MSRARDLSKLFGTNTNGVIPNSNLAVDLTNLSATNLTSGTVNSSRLALIASDIPNLDTAKITSGTFADARISQSSVSQHATSFDDSKLQQDIMVLALRQAVDANKSAYNLSNAFVEQFEDSTGIDVLTDTARNASEYVSTGSEIQQAFTSDANTVLLLDMESTSTQGTAGTTLNLSGNAVLSTAQKKFGTKSLYINATASTYGYISANNAFNRGTGALTVECWLYAIGGGDYQGVVGRWWSGSNIFDLRYQSADAGGNFSLHDGSSIRNSGQNIPENQWVHLAWTRDGSGNNALYYNGTQQLTWSNSNSINLNDNNLILGATDSPFGYVINGYIDEVRLSSIQRYSSNFTPNSQTIFNSTGNFTSVSQTAPTTVSKMGIVVLYKNHYGTATLNTDLVAQVSANNGTNFTTVTLTPRGTFSSGINIAVANNVNVTSGTSAKYKISFANQSLNTKETQVHGVGLIY